MKYLLVLIGILIIFSCSPSSQNFSPDSFAQARWDFYKCLFRLEKWTAKDSSYLFVNKASSNFFDREIFHLKSFAELELVVNNDFQDLDSILVSFELKYKDVFVYLDGPVLPIGIKYIDGIPREIHYDGFFLPFKRKISELGKRVGYVDCLDEDFEDYLRANKPHLNNWLLQEAVRRGVIEEKSFNFW